MKIRTINEGTRILISSGQNLVKDSQYICSLIGKAGSPVDIVVVKDMDPEG